jgi:hypothetical protein
MSEEAAVCVVLIERIKHPQNDQMAFPCYGISMSAVRRGEDLPLRQRKLTNAKIGYAVAPAAIDTRNRLENVVR